MQSKLIMYHVSIQYTGTTSLAGMALSERSGGEGLLGMLRTSMHVHAQRNTWDRGGKQLASGVLHSYWCSGIPVMIVDT